MCGLVGIYSSNMLPKHRDILSSLLYLDTWRGRDSTGVAAIRHNADTSTLKMTIPGYEFIEGPRLTEHLKLNDFCWIGHNRAGTIGRNIRSNAHPFEVDDEDGSCLLVGAHNGTLKNKHVLDDHATFGTDSEALFNHIANNTLKATIPLIEGAWALTYYDHVDEELCMIRNDERPLCYAWEEGKKTLIWASEAWMLRIATSRHGIKLEEDTVYQLPVNKLFAFPVPLKTNDEIVLERREAIAGKAPAFFPRHGQTATGTAVATTNSPTKAGVPPLAQSNLQVAQAAARKLSNLVSGTNPSEAGEKQAQSNDGKSKGLPKPAESSSNVIDIITGRLYKGFAGVKLSFKELKHQLDQGCAWCEIEEIETSDAYAWLGDAKPVCMKCLKGVVDVPIKSKKTVH